MRIKFGKILLELNEVEDEDEVKSELYDENIHIFSKRISVAGNRIEEFKEILEDCKDGGIYSVDEKGEPIKQYKVRSNSYSYAGNKIDHETVYNYNLTFEQVIEKEIKALKIGDLEVIPYRVKQKYDDAVIISASIKLSKDEKKIFDSIEDREGYFDVVRVGINDKAIKMRFGTNIWSEHEDYFKVNTILVEEKYDHVKGLFQPQMQNIMNMLAYHRNLNKELINLLVNKGLVDDSDIDELKGKAQLEINEAHRLFYKVFDADKY
ncbi:hypothetical protein [Clostridium sp.]|uniref:hypothetical protein n=1 Tax=Clostridium sp. TaxID=1506 RepID=UPI002FC5944D